jgi:hypothetical protein
MKLKTDLVSGSSRAGIKTARLPIAHANWSGRETVHTKKAHSPFRKNLKLPMA